MISADSNVQGLDKESQLQQRLLKIEKEIGELDTGMRYELNELTDVLDERIAITKKNLRNEFKQLLKAQMIALKEEDKKPKESLWNFLFKRNK